MKQGADDFAAEATPVIDIRKHGLEGETASANDPAQNWDNDKTEVYMETDEDEAAASLTDSDGETYPITAFPFVLGRGAECDMVLNGKGLSRKHIEIVFQSGRFVVNDLDSLNGMKVNGYKVSRVILEEGDVVKLGEVSLTFSADSSSEPVTKPITSPDAGSADPFGSAASIPKKIAKFSVIFVSVAIVAFGGYKAVNMMLSSPGSVSLVADGNQSKSPVATPSKVIAPKANPVVQQKTVTPTPQAPPPSIALVKAPPPKPKAVISKPKSPAKPKQSKNAVAVKKLLANANARYLDGDAGALFVDFKKYESDSRLPQSLRYQLKSKHESLAKLFGDYSKGQKAYVSGNKDSAFQYWTRFLEREAKAFKSKRSLYADQVVTRVVDEYVSRGNQLSQAGESHKAYKMWQKAVALGDSVAAKIALDGARNKSKQLYRKALRLEYVNSAKAKALWQEVVSLVPPGTEYYTKASSKLAWYERWGG